MYWKSIEMVLEKYSKSIEKYWKSVEIVLKKDWKCWKSIEIVL